MAEDEKKDDATAETSDEKDEAKKEDAPAPKPAAFDAPAADDEDDADDEDEDDEAEEDAASPEAIAKRVAALGEEDEADRIAREEEAKLAERRARMKKKGRGKKGLEAAARKRLDRIGEGPSTSQKRRAAAERDRDRRGDRSVASAVEADPLIEKTAQLSKWARKNQKFVGYLVGAAVIAVAVFMGVTYMQRKKNEEASAVLAKAVADERGRIGDPSKEKDDPDRPKDPTPIFKTPEERRDAALAKYREVGQKFPGTGAAYLARLNEGSLLLDKHDFDAAIAAFNDVRSSALAQADAEVRGRALEGLGFAYELKQQPDEAIKQFRDLENMDVRGFKELGMYHQARVYEAKGDKEKAKELLKSLHERLAKPGEGHPFPYLEGVAEDRLRNLDPTALPPKQPGKLGGGAGGTKMSEAQIRQIIEQMKKAQEQKEQEHH